MKRQSFIIALLLISALLMNNSALGSDKSFEEIVAGVDDRFDSIKTISVSVERVSRKGGDILKENWNYYYKRPDKIKVEYLEPYKRRLSLNKDKFVEYIPDIKKARVVDLSTYRDVDRRAFIERAFSRVSLLGLRLGKVKKGSVTIRRVSLGEFDAYFIESREPDYQIWVDTKTNALLKYIKYGRGGEIVYSTEGSDFKMFDGARMFPQQIKMILPDDEKEGGFIKSEMVLNNMRIDEGINDSLFDLMLSEDIEIVDN